MRMWFDAFNSYHVALLISTPLIFPIGFPMVFIMAANNESYENIIDKHGVTPWINYFRVILGGI